MRHSARRLVFSRREAPRGMRPERERARERLPTSIRRCRAKSPRIAPSTTRRARQATQRSLHSVTDVVRIHSVGAKSCTSSVVPHVDADQVQHRIVHGSLELGRTRGARCTSLGGLGRSRCASGILLAGCGHPVACPAQRIHEEAHGSLRAHPPPPAHRRTDARLHQTKFWRGSKSGGMGVIEFFWIFEFLRKKRVDCEPRWGGDSTTKKK